VSRTLSSVSHELSYMCVTHSLICVLSISVKMASMSLYMCHALYNLPLTNIFNMCVTHSPICVLIVSVKMASVSLYMCHALYHLPLTNSLIHVSRTLPYALTVSVKMASVSLCYMKICFDNVHVSVQLVCVSSYICVSRTLSSPSHELLYI